MPFGRDDVGHEYRLCWAGRVGGSAGDSGSGTEKPACTMVASAAVCRVVGDQRRDRSSSPEIAMIWGSGPRRGVFLRRRRRRLVPRQRRGGGFVRGSRGGRLVLRRRGGGFISCAGAAGRSSSSGAAGSGLSRVAASAGASRQRIGRSRLGRGCRLLEIGLGRGGGHVARRGPGKSAAADRPGALPCPASTFADRDLLLAGGQVGGGGVLAAAVAQPGAGANCRPPW